jgi:hypothetical protein
MKLVKKTFSFSQSFQVAANGSVYFIGIPNGRSITFDGEEYLSSVGGYEVRFLKGVEFTGGQALTGVNTNTADPVTQTLSIIGGPTVANDGNLLLLTGAPVADSPQGRLRSQSNVIAPWHLDSGINYGIKITNLNNQPIDMYAALYWSEYELL